MNKQFCVIGHPIKHSLSPLMHNYAFCNLEKQIGFRGYYGRYDLLDGEKLIDVFWDLKLHGANITVPYKEIAFAQSDVVDGIAKKIGAVNTWVLKQQKIYGYNTDALGFYHTIKDFGFKHVLLLGAGGSARALATILQQKHIKVSILNRSAARLKNLKEFECFTLQNFVMQDFDLIVNATSASLHQELPFEEILLKEIFKTARYAYDLMYGKTRFLDFASKFVPICDGRAMLIAQGALAFELFCGKEIAQAHSLMQSILQ